MPAPHAIIRAMRQQRLGPLDVTITGGADREGGGEGPLVVLLHGFGAPGTDLVPLWRAIDVPRDVRFAFPAAPLTLPSMGFGMESRAWWMIDVLELERAIAEGRQRDLNKGTPVGLVEAREKVLEMLDALDRELSPSALVLGGFSQGAMLSLDVALHSDRALAGLVQWSGTLLDEDGWVPRMGARKGLPVLQSHGRMDPLLPFSLAQALRQHLVASGLDVEFLEFNGGHEIPGRVLDRFGAFLATHLA
jgi:phospholipase/carboxylesterase